ncbi:MAG: potassium channel family protein [Alphaproteobacteria bacterium]|nr:potassium channel family protein [Alphaproteobacteria bacterium]
MPRNTKSSLRTGLRSLYDGRSLRAKRFRYGLLVLDLIVIGYFVAVSMIETQPWLVIVDFFIAAIMLADFLARLWVAKRKLRYLLQPVTMADIVVIVTLLLPVVTENFAFLRVMRALRLVRSYHMVHDLRGRYRFFARNEEIIHGVLNLAVFIFFVTALVYVLQVRINPEIRNYVDALYFTVTTLTTTGFGDITLAGSTGRLLSVIIMIFGVALFLRLVQAIFRTHKEDHRCSNCGLSRHDPDAIHCKHCGEMLEIEARGT